MTPRAEARQLVARESEPAAVDLLVVLARPATGPALSIAPRRRGEPRHDARHRRAVRRSGARGPRRCSPARARARPRRGRARSRPATHGTSAASSAASASRASRSPTQRRDEPVDVRARCSSRAGVVASRIGGSSGRPSPGQPREHPVVGARDRDPATVARPVVVVRHRRYSVPEPMRSRTCRCRRRRGSARRACAASARRARRRRPGPRRCAPRVAAPPARRRRRTRPPGSPESSACPARPAARSG